MERKKEYSRLEQGAVPQDDALKTVQEAWILQERNGCVGLFNAQSARDLSSRLLPLHWRPKVSLLVEKTFSQIRQATSCLIKWMGCCLLVQNEKTLCVLSLSHGLDLSRSSLGRMWEDGMHDALNDCPWVNTWYLHHPISCWRLTLHTYTISPCNLKFGTLFLFWRDKWH